MAGPTREELEAAAQSAEQVAAAQAQQLSILENQKKALVEINASARELGDLNRKIADTGREHQEALYQAASAREKQLLTEVELLKTAQRIGEATQAEVSTVQARYLAEKAVVDEMQKQVDIAQRRAEYEKESLKWADGFIKRWTGIEEGAPKSGIARMIADPAGTVGALATSFKELVTPINVLSSIMDKMGEATEYLIYAQDQAIVSFTRATGQVDVYNDQIIQLERSLFLAGVSAEDSAAAFQSLFLNFSMFSELSETSQTQLAETVAVLSELGISASTVTENMAFAIQAMGMSADEAEELQRELFQFAQDLGVSADQIASDFQAFGPEIAALGNQGVDAFRKLAVQAKATGLQMNEILQITEKFDTFEGAAEQVGQLNALMGGPFLNSLELVAETDPSERFRILKDRLDEAGLSFDQMDYYQRKAYASALGLNEQQLALMMRGRIDLIQEPEKSAKDLEELAELQREFATVMEELKEMGMMLAVSFGDIGGELKDLMQEFKTGEGLMGLLGQSFMFVINVIEAFWKILSGVGTALLLPFVALDKLIEASPLVGFIKAVNEGFDKLNASLSNLGKSLWDSIASPGLIEMLEIVVGVFSSLDDILLNVASTFAGPVGNMFSPFLDGLAAIQETVSNTPIIGPMLRAVGIEAPPAAGAVNAAAARGTALAAAPAGAAAPPGTAGGITPESVTLQVNLMVDGQEFSSYINSVELKEGRVLDGSIAKKIRDALIGGSR